MQRRSRINVLPFSFPVLYLHITSLFVLVHQHLGWSVLCNSRSITGNDPVSTSPNYLHSIKRCNELLNADATISDEITCHVIKWMGWIMMTTVGDEFFQAKIAHEMICAREWQGQFSKNFGFHYHWSQKMLSNWLVWFRLAMILLYATLNLGSQWVEFQCQVFKPIAIHQHFNYSS